MRPAPGARARPSTIAVLVAVSLVCVACPGDERPRGRAPAEPRVAAGTIRLGYPEEPPTLNPVTEASPAATDVLRAVLPSFFLVRPDLTFRPSLLSGDPEVKTSEDRMLVRFRIRSDARWSDGRPITPRDVAFTWRAMTAPENDVARPAGFDHIAGVRVVSPREGVLVLSPPLASWRELFSAGRFVLPAHAADGVGDVRGWDDGPPVTAGPFRLGTWVRGRSIELVADPAAFGTDPLARRIVVEFVPDPTTALQLLERGEVDVLAPMLGIRWVERLRDVADADVATAFGPDLVALVANTASVGIAARRAVMDAIDRRRFVDVVIPDGARVLESVVVPEQTEARRAWSAFGRGDRDLVREDEELTLVYLRGELMDLLARYVQAEVERVGGDLELLALDSDVLRDRFLPEREFDLALLQVRGTPFPDLSPWAFEPGSAAPFTGLSDPRLAALQERVERLGATSPALARAQRALAATASVLPLFQVRTTVAWRAGVAGVVPNPTVEGVLWNAENWSIEAA